MERGTDARGLQFGCHEIPYLFGLEQQIEQVPNRVAAVSASRKLESTGFGFGCEKGDVAVVEVGALGVDLVAPFDLGR